MWRIGSVVLLCMCVMPCRAGWIFDGKPSTWEGTPDELKVVEETYPVLRLELGGQWTDFELKASTNNFETLCYYIMSSGTNAWTTDTNVWIYYTDDYAPDVRKWQKAGHPISICSQLIDPVNSEVRAAIVLPSHECSVDWRVWMSPTNTKLVWSYVRYDGIGFEMNATGTKQRWTAVVPAEWRRERIVP